MDLPEKQGLYDPRNEHDSCGVGFVANIKGQKSHDITRQGLQILLNLAHRGAVGADPLVGDGAGCMIQTPDALLRDWARKTGVDLPPPGNYAVAMCFLPQNEKARQFAVKRLEHFIKVEGQKLIGWRDVPTDSTGLGTDVIERMPVIRQAIVGRGPKVADQDAFERKILTIRKQTQNPLVDLEKKHELPGLSHQAGAGEQGWRILGLQMQGPFHHAFRRLEPAQALVKVCQFDKRFRGDVPVCNGAQKIFFGQRKVAKVAALLSVEDQDGSLVWRQAQCFFKAALGCGTSASVAASTPALMQRRGVSSSGMRWSRSSLQPSRKAVAIGWPKPSPGSQSGQAPCETTRARDAIRGYQSMWRSRSKKVLPMKRTRSPSASSNGAAAPGKKVRIS